MRRKRQTAKTAATGPALADARTEGEILLALARRVWQADRGGDASAAPVPTMPDLVQSHSGGIPAAAVADSRARLAGLYPDLDSVWGVVQRASAAPAVVAISVPAGGPGAVTLRTLGEVHADFVRFAAAAAGLKHPFAPLVRAWQARPVSAAPNLRADPILPARLAQIGPEATRAELALFSSAAHVIGDSVQPGWLPGLERDPHGPCLPLALYDLVSGGRGSARRSQAADLALRMWVEAVLTASGRWPADGRPVDVSVTLRDFLVWFYDRTGRQPRPNEYWPRLNEAAAALDRHDARLPWEDPVTGRGGLRRVVSISDIPRGPGRLDDLVTVLVHIPPGATHGPVVDRERLRHWGRHSAPAYRAMLGLAYRWFRPGVTRIPVGRGRHWVQSGDPERYAPLSDEAAASLSYPTSADTDLPRLARRAWRTLHMMAGAGDVQLIGRRALPPKPDEPEN